MRFHIGNGEKASLWFDYWHPIGPIAEVLGERIIYDSGLGRQVRVASIIDGSSWCWPHARSAALIDLARSMPTDFIPNSLREDDLEWVDDRKGVFSIKSAWEALRSRGPQVSWSRVVWHRKAIPRYAFFLWLAIQGGLYTQDRMMASGFYGCSKCVLCG